MKNEKKKFCAKRKVRRNKQGREQGLSLSARKRLFSTFISPPLGLACPPLYLLASYNDVLCIVLCHLFARGWARRAFEPLWLTSLTVPNATHAIEQKTAARVRRVQKSDVLVQWAVASTVRVHYLVSMEDNQADFFPLSRRLAAETPKHHVQCVVDRPLQHALLFLFQHPSVHHVSSARLFADGYCYRDEMGFSRAYLAKLCVLSCGEGLS